MATLWPRLAAGVGVGAVAASNYSDELWHWLGRMTGTDAAGGGNGMTHSQLVRVVNKQLDGAMSQIKDAVRHEARSSGGGWRIARRLPWPSVSPVLVLKVLCAGGAFLGLLTLLGFRLDDVVPVTRRTVSKQLGALEKTVKGVQHDVEQQFKAIVGSISSYRDEVGETREAMQGAVGHLDAEVANVRGSVEGVAGATVQMEQKLGGTFEGVQLLCCVVAENLPDTPALRGVTAFARDNAITEAPRPSLAGRLVGRLLGTAPTDGAPARSPTR